MNKWEDINHFKADEFLHPELLLPAMAYRLDDLRREFGKPLIVSSSLREIAKNEQVGGVKNSSHLVDPATGFYSGVDLTMLGNRISAADRHNFVRYALWIGFNRIGLYKDHFHLDIETRLPQEVIWLG